MIRIAILGFGKVGQTILKATQEDQAFKERFEVVGLWNRTFSVFESHQLPESIKLYEELDHLMQDLDQIDLVVECAHPNILKGNAAKILARTRLFISSPTAFADGEFKASIIAAVKQAGNPCYIPIGASVGLWDVIRLDQAGQLKSLSVYMKKHPNSFKIQPSEAKNLLEEAKLKDEAIVFASGAISDLNEIAPQNTNTMAIYDLAASRIGYPDCKGTLIADKSLESHIIELELETKGGLKLHFVRDNPANPNAVTGSATFGSFLHSLYHFEAGIEHHNLTFC